VREDKEKIDTASPIETKLYNCKTEQDNAIKIAKNNAHLKTRVVQITRHIDNNNATVVDKTLENSEP
jgi:hypothetical protein